MSDREPWDPIVDPIREIRMRISAQFGHDLNRLGQHWKESEKEFKDRLLSTREAEAGRKDKPAA